MSSPSARLNHLINDAYLKDSKSEALSAYKSYQLSHCYHPQIVRAYDAHSGIYRNIEVGCGKCYHCKQTRINEWVTRMYAHVEDFKNVYFVTLTYRSFSNDILDVNRLMMSKLSQALFHYDSFNQNKTLSFNPCILCKSHYQNFLKRLRKITGYNDITYCVSGEYGKRFGRPHFHLILFSNHDISESQIKRAWSIALFHNNFKGWTYKTSQLNNGSAYYFPIGRVDYHNLVTNGSFNTTERIKIDGQVFNAHNCFAYVCKYVCKGDTFNKFRLNLGYNSLYIKESFVSIDDKEYSYSDAINFYKSLGFKYNQFLNLIKFSHYEKVVQKTSDKLFYENVTIKTIEPMPFLEFTNSSFGTECVNYLLPEDYFAFRTKFAPFVEFSRGTPLGSVYAKNHISEFAKGIFNKPLLQVQSYVLPRYFINKASEFLYGLRKVSKTVKSTSYVKSNLLDIQRLFEECCEPSPVKYSVSCCYNSYEDLQNLIKSNIAFFDTYTKEHILFPVESGVIRVEKYKYDRSSRRYILISSSDFNSFLHIWLEKLYDEQKRFKRTLSDVLYSKSLFEKCQLKLLDMGLDIVDLRKQFEDEQNVFLHQKDTIYNDTHASVE